MKGKKVKLWVQVSDFKVEEKKGVVEDIVKSKWNAKGQLFLVNVDGRVLFRRESELKIIK